MKNDIQQWDWERILIGEVPTAFLLEAVLRLTFVYLLLMVSMRLLGKKMASQMTRNETAAMVSLAAAIGVPVLSPDNGLLPALVIAIVVVLVAKSVLTSSARNEKIERLAQGRFEVLVNEGVMNVDVMKSTGITRERLLSQLRAQEILHLGQVRRLYFEADGKFSIARHTDPMPGLSVIPDGDPEFQAAQQRSDIEVCHACGKTKGPTTKENCENCNLSSWTYAVSEEKATPKKVKSDAEAFSPVSA
jgi:uncharacterized membrane protein YcaP (DUF421 family)